MSGITRSISLLPILLVLSVKRAVITDLYGSWTGAGVGSCECSGGGGCWTLVLGL